MYRIFRLIAVAALMNGWLFGAAKAQGAEIQSTIARQIEAFKTDDFETAFGFASPDLQRMFGSPENFRTMVINGYPMVWRPAELRFLELAEIGGALWQKVLIKDQSGVVHILGYQMLETTMGWKIMGVQVLPAPDVNV